MKIYIPYYSFLMFLILVVTRINTQELNSKRKDSKQISITNDGSELTAWVNQVDNSKSFITSDFVVV